MDGKRVLNVGNKQNRQHKVMYIVRNLYDMEQVDLTYYPIHTVQG